MDDFELAFLGLHAKDCTPVMQPQDAPTAYLFKLWPWIEANKNRLIISVGIAATAIFLFSFFSWRGGQREIEAGRALTQLTFYSPPNSSPSQLANSYLKIANEYPGTLAGRRAWLQGAAVLFAAGQFADAQTQFGKFLEAHPDGAFSALAALGVAASLEAQGRSDSAIGAYQKVINGFSDLTAANAAKFALARIDEQQGKYADAFNFYEDIARANPGTPLATEAGLCTVELKARLASAKPATNKP
jgi:predicted negative regulator of RcsB-dependent stress response